MTILIWIIPAAIIVFLLALIFRRLMLSFLRIPHGMVLVLAVVGATAIAMAINASLLPSELASKIGAAMAGFQVDAGCPTMPAEECEDRASDWYQWVTDEDLIADSTTYLSGEPLRNLVDQSRGYPVPGS